MGRLTILTGTNSAGKSSVLQALALLEQSASEADGALVLNGELVELGTFEDILFDRVTDGSESDDAEVAIAVKNTSRVWQAYSGTAQSGSDIVELRDADGTTPIVRPWARLAYIRADRLGPTVLHTKSFSAVVNHNQIGPKGEFAAHYLLAHRDRFVDKECRLGDAAPTLEAQSAAWLALLSPDIRLYVSDVDNTSSVTLRFSNGALAGLSSGRIHRATNVGFGLSYALPIIVTCLSAAKGDLLLIENPEAHLHPSGQAVLAELCARAVAAGAQVVVETHSDHVLNRIRLSVASGLLRPKDVATYFFRRHDGDATPTVSELTIDEAGRFSAWPEGFFDEYGDALMALSNYNG